MTDDPRLRAVAVAYMRHTAPLADPEQPTEIAYNQAALHIAMFDAALAPVPYEPSDAEIRAAAGAIARIRHSVVTTEYCRMCQTEARAALIAAAAVRAEG